VVRIKRIYDEPAPEDGRRILVDRIWPRGRSQEEVRLSAWLQDLAPSTTLHKWFGHEPERWPEFRERYLAELAGPAAQALLQELADLAQAETVTLVYAARDQKRNNAVVLKELLEERLAASR
jgi:uncharacterized protein YeaO (DUF488 family)